MLANKKSVAGILSAVLLGMTFCTTATASDDNHYRVDAKVYFSPKGGATEALVNAISHAKKSIRVQAFLFSGSVIANALIDAHKKGIDVQVVVDTYGATSPKSKAKPVQASGIEVTVDDKHGTAHNKVMIIDEKTVVTGSFNFTSKAEKKNAENLVIMKSKDLARRYLKEWRAHREHSVALDAYLKNPRPQKYGKW